MQQRREGPDPDDVLLARVAAGEPGAVPALVAAKLPRVLALAGRVLDDPAEAEDVAQDAFERVWRQARRWRPGGAKFDTWLHRVTLNLCYDRLRLRRRRETPMAEPPDRPDPGPGPDRDLLAADAGRRVALALAALPPRQRDALVLCHYQELGNIEAAEALGVTVEALESLLSRGRRRLRDLLADQRP